MIVRFKHISILVLLFLFANCAKERDYEINFTSSILSTSPELFLIEGRFNSDKKLESKGLLFSADSVLTIKSEYSPTDNFEYNHSGKIIDFENAENVTFSLYNLLPGQRYYYRLFSVYDGQLKYSTIKSFYIECLGLGCGPAGGQILYLDGNGGGIEVAVNYVTPPAEWGCAGTLIGGTSTAVGTGQANTTAIVNQCGPLTLAKLCADYQQNGFSDYYMPSIDELDSIFSTVYNSIGNPYGWSGTMYYSSSEATAFGNEAFNFNTGAKSIEAKSTGDYSTIPIRSF
ncbi:MAG: hypothetical protein AB8B74_03220 [Crocinitomicaceae bacterium]